MARALMVGDIGGTHARFAIAEFSEQWHLTDKCDMESGSASFEGLLQDYVNRLAPDRPLDICLAVAGPVVDRAVIFTNRQWRLSEAKLLTFGFARARLLNDGPVRESSHHFHRIESGRSRSNYFMELGF